MVAEIIFFIALILFIILLARRVKASPVIVARLGDWLSNFGRSLYKLGGDVGSRVAKQASRAKQGIPLLTDRPKTPGNLADVQPFWQEETGEQQEIAGLFEEGDELFKKGDYQKAEEFFLKAATRKPNDARVYARLGLIYLQSKNYNDAIEALKVAVKYDKYNPSRFYNLALAYHGNKDNHKAISSIREAISLDPVTKKYRVLLEQLLERK